MPLLLDRFLQRLAGEPAVLVRVQAARGSVPRAPGAWMAVFAGSVVGSIGGGHLEFEAIAHARTLLGGADLPTQRQVALGPSLGQCCGGTLQLQFDPVAPHSLPVWRERLRERHRPLALFGGGHVGTALATLLAGLPFELTWIDSRDGIFAAEVPGHVHCEHSEPVQQAVVTLAPGSAVLVMSFSHAEDLDIVAACLRRQRTAADLPFVGLIGSRSKWATFRHRLQARGFTAEELAHVTCPIGLPGITGKAPEVIAVAVAAQLLQRLPADP